MVERPIIFSGPMVAALLAGAKTQTRRVVKGLPPDPQHVRMCADYIKCDAPPEDGTVSRRIPCPYGWGGDRLWVRETWGLASTGGYREDPTLNYRADGAQRCVAPARIPLDYKHRAGWRTPIYMPRWASRITLEITTVRVQRLQAISDLDIADEGVSLAFGLRAGAEGMRAEFQRLWREIHGAASWDANPWVWALTFKRVEVPDGR